LQLVPLQAAYDSQGSWSGRKEAVNGYDKRKEEREMAAVKSDKGKRRESTRRPRK